MDPHFYASALLKSDPFAPLFNIRETEDYMPLSDAKPTDGEYWNN